MENGGVLRTFGEWEVIAVCLFFMLLLPLIFFVASVRPRPRRPAPAPARGKKKKAPSRPVSEPGAGEENRAQGVTRE